MAIFLPISIILVVVGKLSYDSISARLKEDYTERYEALNNTLAATFKELENSVGKISMNAAYALFQLEKQSGLPSENELKTLAKRLNVSHLYIANSDGVFIRNTDIPEGKRTHKLFDFCEDYRGLLTGRFSMQQTPVLPSDPYTGPYKFTMIPNHTNTRILEVGYHLDYITTMLKQAVQKDKNIVAMSFLSPTGFELGSISSERKKSRDASHESSSDDLKNLIVSTRISANLDHCCECTFKGVADSSGTYFYVIQTSVSLLPFLNRLNDIKQHYLEAFLIAVIFALIVARLLSLFLTKHLKIINNGVEGLIKTNDLSKRFLIGGPNEFTNLSSNLNRMIESMAKSQALMVENEKHMALFSIAKQVAHDIRSPLTALDFAFRSLNGIPEETRELIRGASNRIRDIANNLLESYQRQNQSLFGSNDLMGDFGISNTNIYLVPSLVEALCSEVRAQYRSYPDIEIDTHFDNMDLGLFANVSTSDFSRVISNLVNNSVEALKRQSGKVTVSVCGIQSQIEINVVDNGRGINPKLIPRLTEQGATFGKPLGTGLGLYHAKKCVENWRGSIQIDSKLNEGTKIQIRIPRVSAPKWFASTIEISHVSNVVVVDDDRFIHQVWASRFGKICRNEQINLVHFSSISPFRAWLDANQNDKNLYLMDFEHIGQSVDGLDLVELYGIEPETILVTSHSEDPNIIDRCSRNGVKILPKVLAVHVPIIFSASAK